jgi:hypothetical protein
MVVVVVQCLEVNMVNKHLYLVVVVQCLEVNMVDKHLYLVVEYLLDTDLYKVLMMEDQLDMVVGMIVLPDKVYFEPMVETSN